MKLQTAERWVCIMRVFCRCLVSIALIMFLSYAASAQGVSEKVSPDGSAGKVFNMSGVGDMVQAAGDFRKAAEALERFGGMLKGIVSTLSEGLEESSRNHAVMSDSFDPFGFKTAFKTIREQGLTIQRLQKAEIRRLRKECREMKKRLDGRDRKRKKQKSG
ncbi:MAG: hypothetical protein WBC22_05445 [Sedimentisphaerales bacterium]